MVELKKTKKTAPVITRAPIQKGIPTHVKLSWDSLYENFTTRHKGLKQTPLKTHYTLVNEYMEGRS